MGSALFSSFSTRGLTVPNRIMVSPMCQYWAEQGLANTWHLIHLGNLAMSGAGILCIEGTVGRAGGPYHSGRSWVVGRRY